MSGKRQELASQLVRMVEQHVVAQHLGGRGTSRPTFTVLKFAGSPLPANVLQWRTVIAHDCMQTTRHFESQTSNRHAPAPASRPLTVTRNTWPQSCANDETKQQPHGTRLRARRLVEHVLVVGRHLVAVRYCRRQLALQRPAAAVQVFQLPGQSLLALLELRALKNEANVGESVAGVLRDECYVRCTQMIISSADKYANQNIACAAQHNGHLALLRYRTTASVAMVA